MSEELRYVEAPVYFSSIYKLSDGNEYIVCDKCGGAEIVTESTGYCKNCGAELADAHGDCADADTVEKMMFSYMENINKRIIAQANIIKSLMINKPIELDDLLKATKHHVGYGHKVFDVENGCVISSYLKREDIEVNGETVEKVTWMQGSIASPEIFEKIKNGELKSYSLGGSGVKKKLNNIGE